MPTMWRTWRAQYGATMRRPEFCRLTQRARLRKVATAAGVPPFRIHDMRHTHATILLRQRHEVWLDDGSGRRQASTLRRPRPRLPA